MPKKTDNGGKRRCKDCGKDISHLHHNAIRCRVCSKRRKKIQDRKRQRRKQLEKIRWSFFVEDPDTRELSHRSAKGSRLRYWLDKICKELFIQELDMLLNWWDRRASKSDLPPMQREEYRTCAGMVRDWRDFNVLKEKLDGTSYDASSGVIFNADGTYHTVDLDETTGTYIVRDSEGTVLYQYQ